MDRRNEFVSSEFPRFSYLVSDVIVFVSENSWFQGKAYIDEINKFALRCIKNLPSALPPTLILVQNKANIPESSDLDHFDSDKITSEFLSKFDPNRQLQGLFNKVKCITIPTRDSPIYRKQINSLRVIFVYTRCNNVEYCGRVSGMSNEIKGGKSKSIK